MSLYRFIRAHKTLFVSIIFLVLFSATVTLAVPPSSPYTPGTTLDPACAPGTANCSVVEVGGTAAWGGMTGSISNQVDLQNALAAKEPAVSTGTVGQYYRGDKSWQTLDTSNVPENGNLYYSQARFDTAFGNKSTSNLNEGTNQYYTQARFDTAFGNKSTSSLAEGTNLYYTQARFDAAFGTAFGAKTTSNLNEGTNQYYTQARFDTAFGNKSTSDLVEGTNLYYTQTRFNTAFSAKSTTNLAEGTNLYYTQARFDSALTAKSTSNLAEGSNLYYTAARVQTTGDARYPQLSGSYSNPTWLTALAWSKVTGTPTTVAGYGITDAVSLDPVDSKIPESSIRGNNADKFFEKVRNGTAVVITAEGDSLTYGQQDPTGPVAAINGAVQKRAQYQYPSALEATLQLAGMNVTVVNHGYPGDSTTQGLSRWAASATTDATIIEYGHNDANNYGGHGIVDISTYKSQLIQLVERRLKQGSWVILTLPPDVLSSTSTRSINRYKAVIKEVAKQYNLPIIDVQKEIDWMGYTWQSDGIHLTAAAYNEWGSQAAYMFLQNPNDTLPVMEANHPYHPPSTIIKNGAPFSGYANNANGYLYSFGTTSSYAMVVNVTSGGELYFNSVSTGGTRSFTVSYGNGISQADATVTNTAASTFPVKTNTGINLNPGPRVVFINNTSASNTAYADEVGLSSDWYQNDFTGVESMFDTTKTIQIGLPYINNLTSKFNIGNSSTTQLDLVDTSSLATGIGGGVGFAAVNSAGTYLDYAQVRASAISGTASAESGKLVISVMNAGSMLNAINVLNTGAVGIGTSSPSFRLHVGNSTISGAVARFQNSTGTCDVNPTTSSLVCSSDMTLKKNISNLSDDSTWSFNGNISPDNQSVLAKVMALNPVDYNWNPEGNNDPKHAGFIAQEVRQIFPDLVSADATTGLLSLNYTGLVPYTIQALKEMNFQITSIADLTKPNSFRDSLIAWFGNIDNGIVSFFSKKLTTDEFCIKDANGQSCYSRSQLDSVLHPNSSQQTDFQPAPVDDSANTQTSETGTPEVTPPDVTPPADTQTPATSTPEVTPPAPSAPESSDQTPQTPPATPPETPADTGTQTPDAPAPDAPNTPAE